MSSIRRMQDFLNPGHDKPGVINMTEREYGKLVEDMATDKLVQGELFDPFTGEKIQKNN